jgi:hypothetical protein
MGLAETRRRAATFALQVVAALVAATSLAAVTAVLAAGPADAGGGDDGDLDRRLAERYAPVVVVRAQGEPCGDGEAYLPSPVDLLLGRPDVVLHTPSGDVRAPRARDLFAASAASDLDLPGRVLSRAVTTKDGRTASGGEGSPPSTHGW